MTQAPLLTIVIPVHNRKDVVVHTLESVRKQTLRPLDVVLVDNASTDGTFDVLNQWAQQNNAPDFRVKVVSEPEKGAPAARNRGLAWVDTEWTMFFDSDDTMSPQHAARAIETAAARPDADIVGWDIYMHNPDGTVTVKTFHLLHRLFNCVMHGDMATQRYMARTELFRMAGGWDNNVKVWNDIELGSRLLSMPRPPHSCKVVGEPSVDVFVSDDSITGPDFSHNGPEREFALKTISRNVSDRFRYIIELKRVILAANYRREGARADAQRLRRQAIGNCRNRKHRWLLRIAYKYTACGGRGAARMLRKWF